MKTLGCLAVCLLLPACALAPPRAALLPDAPIPQEGGGGAAPPAPAPAPAAGEPAGKDRSFGRQGGYAGIGALFGFEQFDDDGFDADDSELGVGLKGGYRTKEGFAAEVVATAAEELRLVARPRRVTRADAPIAFAVDLERAVLPSRAQLEAAIRAVVEEGAS